GARSEGHSAAADSAGIEKRVSDSRSYRHDGSLAGAGGGDIFAIEQDGFDCWKIAEARDSIACKMRGLDAAAFEWNGLKQGAAESLDVGADDLVAQAVGIDDGSAFKGSDQAHDLELAGFRAADDLGAGSHVTSLLVSGGDAKTLPLFRFLRRPAKLLRRGFEDVAEPFVGQITEPEFERIEIAGAGEFVHVCFASEVVGGGR